MTEKLPANRKPLEMPIRDIIIGERHRHDHGDIEGLAANIRDDGLFHPVVVTPGRRLIAGARRIRAFQLLERDRIPVTVVDLHKIVRGEYAENMYRKDFTLTEAVAIKRAVEPLIRQEVKPGRPKKGAKRTPLKGKVRDLVAKHTGKARSTLAKAEAIIAAHEAEPDNPKIQKLVAAMDKSDRADGPYRRLINMKQADAIRADPPPLPNKGPYRGVMIDFPWAHEMDDENAAERGVLPYGTMSLKQVCAFARDKIAPTLHDDCVVGLWVTNFILSRSLHRPVLKALGVDPKTVVTWPKDYAGKGHYVKGQTEHIVIATRGKPVVTLDNETTLLQGPFCLVETVEHGMKLLRDPFHLVVKGEHSAKPIEGYVYFESLYPAPRYADWFSRYQHNDTWDCYGDQAPKAEAAE